MHYTVTVQSLPAGTRAPIEPYLIVLSSVVAAVAGAVYLGAQTTLVAAGAALAGFLVVAQLSAKSALILLLPAIVLWIRLGTPARPVLPAPTDALFLALAALLVVQTWQRRLPIRWMATDLFFAGFLLCAFLSMPLSARLTSFAFSLKVELLAYVAFRVVVGLLDDRRDVIRVFGSLMAIQMVLLAAFAYTYVTTYLAGGAMAVVFDRGSAGQAGGVGIPWAYANGFAAHVALLLPVASALALLPGSRARRAVAWMVALASLASLLMSASRGATLAAVLGGLIFLWTHRHRPRLVLGTLAAGAVCVVTLAIVNPAMSLTASRFYGIGDDGSSTIRKAVWQAHADAILERPLLGHGLDNVGLAFSTTDVRGRLDAHNFLLKTAYQTGLLGLGFRLALLGYFGWTLWRVRNASRRDPAMYAAFLAVYVTALANGMVESVFSGERYNLLFMLLMGLLLVWSRQPEPDAR
jgi:O-antigen ligase